LGTINRNLFYLWTSSTK